jgi:hypothetical protein
VYCNVVAAKVMSLNTAKATKLADPMRVGVNAMLNGD